MIKTKVYLAWIEVDLNVVKVLDTSMMLINKTITISKNLLLKQQKQRRRFIYTSRENYGFYFLFVCFFIRGTDTNSTILCVNKYGILYFKTYMF